MGQPLHVNMIEKRIESHLRQLEQMAYTKDRDRLMKLSGHIEEALECGGLTWTAIWSKRLHDAAVNVMADPPKQADTGLGILADIKLPPIAPEAALPPLAVPSATP